MAQSGVDGNEGTCIAGAKGGAGISSGQLSARLPIPAGTAVRSAGRRYRVLRARGSVALNVPARGARPAVAIEKLPRSAATREPLRDWAVRSDRCPAAIASHDESYGEVDGQEPVPGALGPLDQYCTIFNPPQPKPISSSSSAVEIR